MVFVCEACTFVNETGTACAVCGTPHQAGAAASTAAAPGRARAPAAHGAASDGAFTVERLSDITFKVVENDRFGQYPLVYVVLGADKCVVIDTGCDTSDVRAYIGREINTRNLPYLIINTHVHFDHVGGNHRFAEDALAIAMSSANPKFSQNLELTSLCAGAGTKVQPFEVTRWLDDGDLVFLDDHNPDPSLALHVLHTPGHTPDSLSLFLPAENRLFVGDLLFPFVCMSLAALGASAKDLAKTLERLQAFAADKPGLVFSCGHVEPALPASSALSSLEALLQAVRAGYLPPTRLEDGGEVAEYSNGQFSLLLPQPLSSVTWE